MPQANAEGLTAEKNCRRCEVSKSVNGFAPSRRNKDGLQSYCRPCNADYHREYQARNSAKLKIYKKQYYQQNSEREKDRSRTWYRANTDRAKVRQSQYQKEWRASNRELARSYWHVYRARKMSSTTVPFTADELAQRWEYYGNRCWLCPQAAQATDHVKPLAKGGAHMLCNLRPICRSCNSRKQDAWPMARVIERVVVA